jgi:hypothetical protein
MMRLQLVMDVNNREVAHLALSSERHLVLMPL